jgi:hypothetical protein
LAVGEAGEREEKEKRKDGRTDKWKSRMKAKINQYLEG